ncbi:hypothetical protein D7D52_30190 [Nocardia yunnanensis]|uniref:Cell wall anchor protein n=1 Tax=Nocardia yunnanensis TaxID=2382165 RepID=A0A386ZJQ4_9NOCA|nr:DUF6319 family protein [Nocardia yunnanensis]AYF77384.1 hypothetical protein D7D52_30190 [Nocardia yunnanensis]
MSTRTKPQPLSDTEIRRIATEIDAGKPPMVWFTAAAVGVPEGRSGKVMSLGDPSEGDFLQVKPTGSKDVLSFGPTEVTLTKPGRPTPAKPTGTTPKTATRKESTVSMPSPVTTPAAPSTPAAPAAPAVSSTSATPQAKPETSQPAAESAEAKANKPAASRPARNAANAAAAKKPKAAEVTVTLSGTAEGEWTLDVVNGKKRTIKGLPVASSAVAQAAKILHPEFAEVVDSIHESVRAAQQAKVAQLQAELESARRLLEDLA